MDIVATMSVTHSPKSVRSELTGAESHSIAAYDGIVGGAQLTRVLGYPSQAAFRQAVARGRVPVPVFTIDGRRGKFARTRDIALWLDQGGRKRLDPTPSSQASRRSRRHP